MLSLADQVQAEIGERKVELHGRGVTAPFTEPLAENQGIVSKRRDIGVTGVGGHQMCFMLSGTT